MEEKHYVILKYLSEQTSSVKTQDFPIEIQSQYHKSVVLDGSLHHELQIKLKHKGWIEVKPGHAGYWITDLGRAALKIEQQSRDKEEQRQRKKDQLTDLTITQLVDKVIDSPKVKDRLFRSEIIAGASALVGLVSAIAAIAALKGC